MKVVHLCTVIFVSSLSFSAFSASKMKPGLWEHSFTIQSESGQVEKAMSELKKQMANMPAEQRKMMEETMAKQGIELNKGDANTIKMCISKEQAENLDIPQGQDKNCKNEVISRTADSIKMKFKCDGAHATSGEGEFKIIDPTSYVGKATIDSNIAGKKEHMKMDQKGKWLSDNCGNIKPVQIKK